MNSTTYCSHQDTPKGAQHGSKGFRESKPHNLLAGLDWFSCTSLSDETARTPQGIKIPSASPLRTSSSWCSLFHTSVQSALSDSCTEQASLHGLLPAILPAQQENASSLLSGGRGHSGATKHSGSSHFVTHQSFLQLRDQILLPLQNMAFRGAE